jgi:Fe2+ or Zn2+ uptake regulation protein
MTPTYKALKAEGIRPSHIRMIVYDYLKAHKSHPTVDTIYQALAPNNPTLSKTSVYNTLKVFVKHHIAHEIILEEQKHYDFVLKPHAHFTCDVCHTVYDLDIKPPTLNEDAYDAHCVQLIYRGVCKNCQHAMESHS